MKKTALTFWLTVTILFQFLAQVPERTPPPPPPPVPEVEDIFTVVEEIPCFPTCQHLESYEERKQCVKDTILARVYSNLEYPAQARAHRVEGTVVIRFLHRQRWYLEGLSDFKRHRSWLRQGSAGGGSAILCSARQLDTRKSEGQTG